MGMFWDCSWENADAGRIAGYVERSEREAGTDAVIEYLRSVGARMVCDAGCGCGAYCLRLARNGFSVSGFDISARAVEIARRVLGRSCAEACLKVASLLETGYDDSLFDAVVSRDVVDHMPKRDAVAALEELCRIVRPGGVVFVTLDFSDGEYESEPHAVNGDGDYLFNAGKWDGMVFHPYSEDEIAEIVPDGVDVLLTRGADGFVLRLDVL